MTDELEDAAFVAKMELTQLRAGDVLTIENVEAINDLFREMGDDMEAAGDAFGQGERKGREEAGGKEVADLLERIDALKGELSIQKALTRFLGKVQTANYAEGHSHPDTTERSDRTREDHPNPTHTSTKAEGV